MKIIQLLAQKLLGACAVVAGLFALVVGVIPADLRVSLNNAVRDEVALDDWRWVIGLALAGVVSLIVGWLALSPSAARKARRKVITFQGPHGKIIIQLDSVEATLNRVVAKHDDVRKVSATLLPDNDGQHVRIAADVVIHRGTGVRDTATRVSAYIASAAGNLLGTDEVSSVDLNVRGIVADGGEPTPESRGEPAPSAPAVSAAEPPELGRWREPNLPPDLDAGGSGREEEPLSGREDDEAGDLPESRDTSFSSLHEGPEDAPDADEEKNSGRRSY